MFLNLLELILHLDYQFLDIAVVGLGAGIDLPANLLGNEAKFLADLFVFCYGFPKISIWFLSLTFSSVTSSFSGSI